MHLNIFPAAVIDRVFDRILQLPEDLFPRAALSHDEDVGRSLRKVDSRLFRLHNGAAYDGLELSDVSAEIGKIIIGEETGRESDDEIILASSVGMGIQDIIVAHEAFEQALKKGVGTVLEF